MTPEEFTRLGYQAIDFACQHLYGVRSRKPYAPMPFEMQQRVATDSLTSTGMPAEEVLDRFFKEIAPWPTCGTGHPRSFAWIAGGPDPMAVLASLLSATLNPNAIGGEQSATYAELAVLRWLADLLGFPSQEPAGGILVNGGTSGTLLALAAARLVAVKALGSDLRREGAQQHRLTFYASDQAHHCVESVIELLGIGRIHLRLLPITNHFCLDPPSVRQAIRKDREAGFIPVALIANAGTTNTGSIDPLDALADICEAEHIWFHIDGAYGALGRLDPLIAPRFQGMERADSLILDPHKWMGIPYASSALLVRDKGHLISTFGEGEPPSYLRDFGFRWGEFTFELSRRFQALPLWMAFLEQGQDALAQRIQRHNALARLLAQFLDSDKDFERLNPVELSTVCFRLCPTELCGNEKKLNLFNENVLRLLREESDVFLAGTVLQGRFCLRACIQHEDTQDLDIEALVAAVKRAGKRVLASQPQSR